MRSNSRFSYVAVVIGFTACLSLRASEPIDEIKVNYRVRPKSNNRLVHTREVVQKTPNFAIRNGNATFVPSRAGFIYQIERADRNQLLISMPSQGLLGWVPREAVVEYNQAEGFFTKTIDFEPQSSFAHLMRAIVCQDNNRLDQSFADLAEAIRLDPRNTSAWIERAFLWQMRNRMDLALADVNKAIQIDPRSSEAFVERGVFRYCLKEYGQAFSDFEQAAKLGSRSVSVPMTKGMILLQQKELDDAEAEFRRALQIDPKITDAHVAIGSIQLMRSQRAEAVSSFSQAITIDPEKGSAYGGRAAAYLAMGEHKRALQDLNNAIRIDPAQTEYLRNRGAVYSHMGEWYQALADLETALRLTPNDIDAHLTRAWMLATCPEPKLRDGPKAVTSATRACELTQWKKARPLAALAAAYSESGDFPSAVRWQQKAIELTLDDDSSKRYYQSCLERYRSGKPCHRLSPLEEIGIRRYQPASKPTGRTAGQPNAGGSST
jgi:tetratricopeptide (TPR) repeat protein